jgi:hypothetical protein
LFGSAGVSGAQEAPAVLHRLGAGSVATRYLFHGGNEFC